MPTIGPSLQGKVNFGDPACAYQAERQAPVSTRPRRVVSSKILRPALEHDQDRLDHDPQIELERPRTNIFQIQSDHVIERDTGTAFPLPKATDAWLDLQNSPQVPGL